MSISKLFLSAGAMKAGTSYLYKMLEKHPEIETTPVKEVHYFAHCHTPLSFLDDSARLHNLKNHVNYVDAAGDVAATRRELAFFSRYLRLPIDDAWYENLFESGASAWKADFSNMASVLPDDGLRHIRRIADNVRIVYLLRDPLERLWSHIKFHAAVNSELDLLNGFEAGQFSSYLVSSGALAQGSYAENYARMQRFIAKTDIKIVYFEDLITKPQQELRAIFEFLEVETIAIADDELREVHNPGPDIAMPTAFIAAALPCVRSEIEKMRVAEMEVHGDWRQHHGAPKTGVAAFAGQ